MTQLLTALAGGLISWVIFQLVIVRGSVKTAAESLFHGDADLGEEYARKFKPLGWGFFLIGGLLFADTGAIGELVLDGVGVDFNPARTLVWSIICAGVILLIYAVVINGIPNQARDLLRYVSCEKVVGEVIEMREITSGWELTVRLIAGGGRWELQDQRTGAMSEIPGYLGKRVAFYVERSPGGPEKRDVLRVAFAIVDPPSLRKKMTESKLEQVKQ